MTGDPTENPGGGETSPSPAPVVAPDHTRMRAGHVPDPLALVIFGGTGDLARRKLMPALYRLFVEGLLPEDFAVLGVARDELDEDAYRTRVHEGIVEFAEAPEAEAWSRFSSRLFYLKGDFADPEAFRALGSRLTAIESEQRTSENRLFYLAVPPAAIGPVVAGLAGAGLAGPATRVIVEKPFGHDLRSARELNGLLLEAFDEPQVFRIDHYLGKETVQNLLVFRFGNVIWEPIWNRTLVEHVQITVSETVGVERRAGYYEKAGALRDMMQSHLLQLLALAAMEPPSAYDADSIRDEKVKLLRSIQPFTAATLNESAVRGQYSQSHPGASPMPGYREEPGVDPASRTETFVALRIGIQNWRWAGVPFYLRTGKRLPAKASEIVVRFRSPPHPILDRVQCDQPTPNALVLRVQPEEGISLYFEAKVPGLRGPLQPVSMDFSYASAFGVEPPEAYQRLLLDAMLGDATLFARKDEVEAAWALVDPILAAWASDGEPEPYPAGSWGPPGADALLADSHSWKAP